MCLQNYNSLIADAATIFNLLRDEGLWVEGFNVGLKTFFVGIIVFCTVGLEVFLIDGTAVGLIDWREVGVLVDIFLTNAVGEAVNFAGGRVSTAVGDTVNFVGECVVIATEGAIRIVGFLDASNVGAAVDMDGVWVLVTAGEAEGMEVMTLIFIISSLNNVKFTDPRPVVGSQPVVALKPSEQQGILNPTPQLFSPTSVSITNDLPLLYSVGFNHPSEDMLASRRAALTKDTIAARTGVDADVPDALNHRPPIMNL